MIHIQLLSSFPPFYSLLNVSSNYPILWVQKTLRNETVLKIGAAYNPSRDYELTKVLMARLGT